MKGGRHWKLKAKDKILSFRSGQGSPRNSSAEKLPTQPAGKEQSVQASEDGADSSSQHNDVAVSGESAQKAPATNLMPKQLVTTAQCKCWNEAVERFRNDSPEAYTQLEAIQLDTERLTRMIETKFGGLEGEAKTKASNQWFGRLKRFLPALGSIKGLTMAVLRLDPHQIAPYIGAGIFCALELALNVLNPDDVLLILEVASETTILLRKWLLYEIRAASIGNLVTRSTMDELFQELPVLYGRIIRLLSSINSHLNGIRLKKALDRAGQIDVRWKAMFEEVKQANKKCDAIKSQAEFQVNAQKDGQAALNWISTRALEESHSQILERTDVLDKYKDRGAWFFQSPSFQEWEQGIQGNSQKRIMWLKGHVGTGKTTLMCRAIERFMFDQSVESTNQVRIAYFYCSARSGSESPDAETVTRAVLRQLALLPDFTVSTTAEVEYKNHEQSHAQKTAMSLSEWKELFIGVLSSVTAPAPCIIVIDALDECATGEAEKLLGFLGSLVRIVPHVFLLISSQLHVKVPVYINDDTLVTLQTGSLNSREDIIFYVETEIKTRMALPLNMDASTMSAEVSEDLRKRLKAALVSGANGMFQWAKTWLAIMFPLEPIAHRAEAEDLISALERQHMLDESGGDQWKSLNEAYLKLYTKIRHRPADRKYKVRVYRVILGARNAMTPAAVAEAASVEIDGTMATSVNEKYVREVCHNFFIETAGCLQVAHESARLFLQNMSGASGDVSQCDDYATFANNAEIARICMRVLTSQQHPLWKSHSLKPESWTSRFKDIDQLNFAVRVVTQEITASREQIRSTLRLSPDDSFADVSDCLLRWCKTSDFHADHFGSYVVKHWLDHWEAMVKSVNKGHLTATEVPLENLVMCLQNPSESALLGSLYWVHVNTEVPRLLRGKASLPFDREQFIWDHFYHRFYAAKRLSACFVKGRTHPLVSTFDLLWFTMLFYAFPRVYISEYFRNQELPPKIVEPEPEFLFEFLDKIMTNLNFSDEKGVRLLETCIAYQDYTNMAESILRLEKSRTRINMVENILRLEKSNKSINIEESTLGFRQSCNRTKSLEKEPMEAACIPASSFRATLWYELWNSKLLLIRDSSGNMPLHQAARITASSSTRIITTLLNLEADQMGCRFPGEKNKKDWHPSGWLSRLACQVNDDLETPLHVAAHSGNSDVVSILIEAGAAEMPVYDIHGVQLSTPVINSPNKFGQTPLFLAAGTLKSGLIIQQLLRLPNIEVNIADKFGATPIHQCVKLSNVLSFQSMAFYMNDERTKVDLADSEGKTPLWRAAESGRSDFIELLCTREDVDVNAQSKDGRTPLWIAQYNCLRMAHKASKYRKAIATLLATGKADTNPVDNEGLSPAARFEQERAEEPKLYSQ